jgi:hypothetical protein
MRQSEDKAAARPSLNRTLSSALGKEYFGAISLRLRRRDRSLEESTYEKKTNKKNGQSQKEAEGGQAKGKKKRTRGGHLTPGQVVALGTQLDFKPIVPSLPPAALPQPPPLLSTPLPATTSQPMDGAPTTTAPVSGSSSDKNSGVKEQQTQTQQKEAKKHGPQDSSEEPSSGEDEEDDDNFSSLLKDVDSLIAGDETPNGVPEGGGGNTTAAMRNDNGGSGPLSSSAAYRASAPSRTQAANYAHSVGSSSVDVDDAAAAMAAATAAAAVGGIAQVAHLSSELEATKTALHEARAEAKEQAGKCKHAETQLEQLRMELAEARAEVLERGGRSKKGGLGKAAGGVVPPDACCIAS